MIIKSGKFDLRQGYGCYESALHLAVAQANSEMVQLLIEHKADVNQVNLNFQTPLHVAFEQLDTSLSMMFHKKRNNQQLSFDLTMKLIIELLVFAGARPNGRALGWAPIHTAVKM